jgi:hypothetical protein
MRHAIIDNVWLSNSKVAVEISTIMLNSVWSTCKESISARNAMDAHASDFMATDRLLLPILKALAQ